MAEGTLGNPARELANEASVSTVTEAAVNGTASNVDVGLDSVDHVVAEVEGGVGTVMAQATANADGTVDVTVTVIADGSADATDRDVTLVAVGS